MAKRKRETIGLGFTKQGQTGEVGATMEEPGDLRELEPRRMGTPEEQLAFLRRFPGPYSVIAEAVVRKVQAGLPVYPDPLLSPRSFPPLAEGDVFLARDTVEEEQTRVNEQAFLEAEEEERRRQAVVKEEPYA